MEIKCNINPNYLRNYPSSPKCNRVAFSGVLRTIPLENVGKDIDKFVKRPVDVECVAGLLSLEQQPKKFNIIDAIRTYCHEYVKNIQHTFDHKVIYALIEKELYGKNTINSLTHDADKMIMYLLGFPKSFVSKFHRLHSTHHTESGKMMNIESMLCDNIASSPEFKPEKKLSLRAYFNKSKELQEVDGLKELMERYNFGENIDFDKIKTKKQAKEALLKSMKSNIYQLLSIWFI